MHTDPSGEFTCLYRPYHMIGLETNITVAQIACRHEPTGCSSAFRSDVVAVAKFDIPKGTVLDGEGGFWVYGNATPAKVSVEKHLLPLNFTEGKKVLRDIKAGETRTFRPHPALPPPRTRGLQSGAIRGLMRT